MSDDQSFSKVQFLGASVSTCDFTLGWGGESSSVSIVLAEDDGEIFSKPLPGLPAKIAIGDLTFAGIIQNWKQSNNISTNPIYQLTLTDPREILNGSIVITDVYIGDSLGLPNLINAYGAYPFGQAGVTDTGMPWVLMEPVLSAFTYTFRGYNYTLDLSELPGPPITYKISGKPTISVLDAIDQLCNDSGRDFYVTLTGDFDVNGFTGTNLVIHIKTVDRTQTPPPIPAKIDYFRNLPINQGLVVDYTYGQELRNDVNSVMLFGDNVQDLYQSEAIQPFWGFDINNNPIVSRDKFTLDVRQLNWPALGFTYDTDVIEMQAILGGQTVWESWIALTKPALSDALGIVPQYDFQDLQDNLNKFIQGKGQPKNIQHLPNSKKGAAFRFNRAMQQGFYLEEEIGRLYNFLHQVAQTHYGKKFLAQIPTPARYVDATTGDTKCSLNPTQSAWMESNSYGQDPLDLSNINDYLFQDEHFKFEPFVRFDLYNNIDLSYLNNQVFCFQQNSVNNQFGIPTPVSSLYIKAQVGDKVIFLNNNISPNYNFNTNLAQQGIEAIANITNLFTATVEITLPDPIYAIPTSGYGSDFGTLNLVRTYLKDQSLTNGNDAVLTEQGLDFILDGLTNSSLAGTLNLPSANPVLIPNFVAVPLKSEVNYYGPWAAVADDVQGKIEVIHEPTFTPWNYGSYAQLNAAADDYVLRHANGQTHQEMGSVTIAGLPKKQLGDFLVFNGPIITNITVAHSIGGVTTTYNMQTYTKRFGDYGKDRQERFQRYGRAANRLVNALQTVPLYSTPRLFPLNGPTGGRNVLTKRVGNLAVDKPEVAGAGFVSGQGFGTAISTNSISHFINNCKAHNPDLYQTVAGVDSRGIFRSYTIDPSGKLAIKYAPNYNSYLVNGVLPPKTILPLNIYNPSFATTPNRNDLNPFKYGNDMFIVSGSGYIDIKDPTAYDANTARPMALRGPLVLAGWGYDTLGLPVPNQVKYVLEVIASGETIISSGLVPSGSSTSFATDYLTNPSGWRVGPVDLRWDRNRHVWAVPKPDLAIVIAHSGQGSAMSNGKYIGAIDQQPIYICRRKFSIDSTDLNRPTFNYAAAAPLTVEGDITVSNIQEGLGALPTIGIGSRVLLYAHGEYVFMNEHVRTFTRQTGYSES